MRHNDIHDKSSIDFTFFDSMSEFASVCSKKDVRQYAYTDSGSDKWAGGSYDDALGFARHGDVKYVKQAEALVEKIDAGIDTEGLRPVWSPSVVGNFPLVPAYLAGTPEAMLARTDVPDARGDLELWVEMGCSACVSQRDMRRRGVCVLAAVMALQRVRNVRVVLFSAYNHTNITVKLQYPLDVSEACGAIAQTSVTRQLFYNCSKWILGGQSSIPFSEWCRHGQEGYRNVLTRYAEMPADAELLTMQRLGDWGKMSDDELIESLNKMLRRLVAHERE